MSLLRFIPGILILQAATAGLVAAALGYGIDWVPLGLFAFIMALLVAFWFSSVAEHVKKDALLKAREAFAAERERIIISAEADKRNVVEESHKRIVKETSRAHAKANFKVGVAFAAMLCAGALLLSVQLFTVGFLTLAASAGALGGYLARARQEALASKRRAARSAVSPRREIELITSEGGKSAEHLQSTPGAVEGTRRRRRDA